MSLKDALEARELYLQHNENPLLKRGLEIKELAKPMTNGDGIRAMTDEEQEDFIRAIAVGYEPWCDLHCKMDGDGDCNECLKKWIKQPLKGDAE